ncbi:MAG TPA: prepilin-type N-terminal cleavage/methylation domain-containing protein [Gemmatimonadales bacterium]|nr:prepilin-type N-terminal cleavage/methylation domain-containing protein [Gemmatimonadales bacterium]
MSRGTTLVELLVVLVLLGVVFGMSALARGRSPRAGLTSEADRVQAGRAKAIRTGLPVQVLTDSGQVILVLPDGRAIGHGVDPLSGALRDAH